MAKQNPETGHQVDQARRSGTSRPRSNRPNDTYRTGRNGLWPVHQRRWQVRARPRCFPSARRQSAVPRCLDLVEVKRNEITIVPVQPVKA